MEKEALNFIYSLQTLYLEQRDMKAIENIIDERISCIGTGEREIFKTYEHAAKSLKIEENEYPDGFQIVDSWYEAIPIFEKACIVYGEFWAKSNNSNLGIADLHNRISAVCIKDNDKIKLLHIHLSSPDDNQENGEYFVKRSSRTAKIDFKKEIEQAAKALSEKNREFEILVQNIPGGVYRCKYDNMFTLMSMSGGFLSAFGYTREEIKSVFNDSLINMIYEPDRAAVIESSKGKLSNDTTLENEYRVTCKNGELIWVLDRGRLVVESDNTQTFFCMIIDITLRKIEKENLRLSLERHKVIMDQATDILFEWDINSDKMDFSTNWEKRFGYPPIVVNISKNIPKSVNIYPDDMPSFIKIMNDTLSGVQYSEAEFRIRNISGAYRWCKARATTQFDSDKHPIRAIGILVDIDNEKSKSDMLIEAAQCDALTNLYNKNATKIKIEDIISEKGQAASHALMIIDVDNFKTINDRFGHQCGDEVLHNMAHGIKKLFRTTDIVGRIGGDEFLVFMTNVTDETLVAAKSKEIVDIFKLFPKEICGDLSCSVGVAFYPKDATNYASLLRCADSALYYVKNNGKFNFALYEASVNHDMYNSAIRNIIKYDVKEHSVTATQNNDLIQYAFNLLYNAHDIVVAINQILEIVGHCYDVSRVYIFENSDDGKYCNNTFEWCNDGIKKQIDNLQHLSFETDLAGFFDIYDESGVFYCHDIKTLNDNLRMILESQGIVSVLQCFILDDGNFNGYIGFDECTQARYWTKDEIHALTLIANMISTFLVKKRLKEKISALEGLSNI